MPLPRHIRSYSNDQDGLALIIVLAFIVLITILLVSFVSFTQLNHQSTASYSKAIQTQEIAQGGLLEIVGDLHQEILAGSTASSATPKVYLPTTNLTAVPARIGYNPTYYTNDVITGYLPPTLVRVSRASQDGTPTHFYPNFTANSYFNATTAANLINRASAANSTANSFNGRYISASRWNKINLLTTNSTIPAPFSTNTPDWVYVTRTGSRVCTTAEVAAGSLKPSNNLAQNYGAITPGSNPPVSPVTGRYSYAVYDEGALLDMSAAGYTHWATNMVSTPVVNNPNNVSQAVYGKSYLAYADLTQLPGLSGSQSTVDTFVSWRNASANLAAASAATGTNYLQAVFSNAQNGFLTFQNNSNGTDSPFLGRQDLINYFANLGGTYSSALPYLGTFSRAVNGPTWFPQFDSSSLPGYIGGVATSVVSYNANMENTGVANRDLANLRWTSASSITHYGDNGVASIYSVNSGDPMLQRRFSLAKLAWLAHAGPATGISAAAIQSCFGLAWNSTALRWDYYGSTGSTTVGSIETLDQVAGEKREPNFFELLKAGILSGSLGKNPGVVAAGPFLNDFNGTSHVEGPMGSGFDQTSNNSDFQIIQIGVDIIDQSRADNYPSAIYFHFNPGIGTYTPTELALYQTAFGKKNLPYLQGMGEITAVTADVSSTMETFSVWLQPELWNPHQNPYGAAYPGTVAPTQLRLVTVGQATVVNEYDSVYPTNPSNPSSPIDFGEDPTNPFSSGLIYFKNSANFFNNPVLLTDSYAGSTATPSQNIWPSSMPHPLDGFASFSGSGNQFYGVFCGTVERPLTNPPINPAMTSSAPGANNIRINPQTPFYPLTFVLEYFDGTNWLPYSMTSRVNVICTQQLAGGAAGNGVHAWGSVGAKTFFGSVDPRTDRFSVSHSNAQGFTAPNGWPSSDTIQWNTNSAPTFRYGSIVAGYPHPNSGFNYTPSPVDTSDVDQVYFNLWAQNQVSPAAPNPNASLAYYPDPDGVVRPGDAFRATLTTGDGMITFHSGNPAGATTTAGRRPVVLDRTFLSVGELGYVFRDLPFKTLDFWSSTSADAALLDLFSVTDEPQLVAGQINLNNSPVPVVEAIIAGTMQNQPINLTLAGGSSGQGATLAAQLSAQWSVSPLRSRADLVPTVSNAITAALGSYSNLGNKAYGEAPVRALADVASTRTWNLLIDIIAQSGQMSPTAATLNDFIVQGERRYWLHIAIDRYTGKIIDQQLEPVYE